MTFTEGQVERLAFEAMQWTKVPENNPGCDQPSLVFARRFAFLAGEILATLTVPAESADTPGVPPQDFADPPALTTARERLGEAADFYEREFYPLSNFSAFTIMWPLSPREGLGRFDTSEAVYHWEKFKGNVPDANQRAIQSAIRCARSAHEAFKIAEENRRFRRPKWDDEKVEIMRQIIRAKAEQHEYCRRKLLETGTRPLIEGSWRDDFWGIGPNGDGQNMLGKLWMELRSELEAARKGEG